MNSLSMSLPASRLALPLGSARLRSLASPETPALPAPAPRDTAPSPPPSSCEPVSRTCRPTWAGRVSTFASDSIDAGRLFTAVGAANGLGQVARLSSMVWGPVMAGIGMAVGGIEVARSAFATTPTERRHLLADGALDMAISGAALVATTGLSPTAGAITTAALVGIKLASSILWPDPGSMRP